MLAKKRKNPGKNNVIISLNRFLSLVRTSLTESASMMVYPKEIEA
jgi:hypothetical protein